MATPYAKNVPVDFGSVNTGPLPENCAKIEDEQIGQDGVFMKAGNTTVTFTSWTPKEDGPEDSIGFFYEVESGCVWMSVKAGLETFLVTESDSWVHPNGTSGSLAKGISNVVACETPCEDPGYDEGDEDFGEGDGEGDGEGNGEGDDGEGDDDGPPSEF